MSQNIAGFWSKPTKGEKKTTLFQLNDTNRWQNSDDTPFFKHHHRHHLSLNREGYWGTTHDFTTSFLHLPLFATALWDLANSRPVYSLMLSSHLFLCLPCLLSPFTVPCKIVPFFPLSLCPARPDERETWPYHCSLRLFTMVRRSSCGPIACWILARTSSNKRTNRPLIHKKTLKEMEKEKSFQLLSRWKVFA